MDDLEYYFKEKTGLISFIELKDDSNYEILDKTIPYPVINDIFIKGISKGEYNNEISIETIIDGIIVLYSIDSKFKYMNSYTYLLKKLTIDPVNYAFNRGINYQQQNNPIAIYFFRFNYLNDDFTPFGIYNYARLLYMEYEKNRKDEGLRKESIRLLEYLINEEEDFPLSYFELGLINKKEGHYIKAEKLIIKASEKIRSDGVIKEIQEELNEVKPYSLLELAISEIERAELQKAYSHLLEAEKYTHNAPISYYKGKILSYSGNIEMAIIEFEKSLEQDGKFKEIFQDLSIEYYKDGQIKKALDTIEKGLAKYKDEPYLMYNRILINLGLGKEDKAREDISILLEYGDLPDDVVWGLKDLKKQDGYLFEE